LNRPKSRTATPPPTSRPRTGVLALALVSALLGAAPAATSAAATSATRTGQDAAGHPARATVVDVTAFGADRTGRKDSAPAVKAALRHAKTLRGPVRLVFPKGTYQLYPEHAEQRELYVSNTVGADQRHRDKRIGILIEDMNDVVVDGQGSRLEYHGLQTAFAAIRSHNVTFTGFAFDYAAPKVVDATVSAAGVADGHAYRVLSVPADSPYRVAGGRITWLGETSPVTGEPYWSGDDALEYTQIHDPAANRTWRDDNTLFDGVSGITDLGGHRVRITYTGSQQPADRGLVYQMRQTTREQPGALIWQSSDVSVRNVDARQLQTFGLVGQFSENITIDHVDFAPDPASGHSTAAFADFVQMSGVKGTVSITNSVFDGPQDDPINIHGTYLEVTGEPTPTSLTVDYKHPETAGFPQYHVGDQVQLVDKKTMLPVAGGQAKVASVDGPSGEDHDHSLTSMTVTLDRPVPAGVAPGETVLENTTYTPKVRIAGNVFRNVPTRGVLVTTPKPVLIENNRFEKTSMAAVYISADAYQWYESGAVDDVTIRGNTFTAVASPVIFVEPTNQVLDASRPVHRNIRIERNTFDIGDVTVVDAKSVGGLTVARNTVRRLDTAGGYAQPLYAFHGSTGVLISRNVYAAGLNARANTSEMDAAQVTVEHDPTKLNQDHVLPGPVGGVR
jgi:hypothetical protein